MPSFIRHAASLAVGGLLARREFSTFKAAPEVTTPPVECSMEQEAEVFRLWDTMDNSKSACDPYVVSDNGSLMYAVPCSANECLKELEILTKQFPDCGLYGGNYTESEMLEWLFDDCKDGKSNFTQFPPQELPVPTNLCTTSQIEETAAVFVEASKLDECKDNTIAWSEYVGILTTCNSTCAAATAKLLNESLPDCYYEFDAENKKQVATEQYASNFCQGEDSTSSYFNYFRDPSTPGLGGGDTDVPVDEDKTDSPGAADQTKAPGGAAVRVDASVAAAVSVALALVMAMM